MTALDVSDPDGQRNRQLFFVPRDPSVSDLPGRRSAGLDDYDQLTALANPSLFLERLIATVKRYRSRRESFALLLLELDDLKPIIERYGPSAGDHAVCEFAKRLRTGLRGCDTAARLGDERFAVILEEIIEQSKVSRVLERIERQSRKPIAIKGALVQIPIRIGCTLYPQDGIEPWEILQSADQAVCRMKASRPIAVDQQTVTAHIRST